MKRKDGKPKIKNYTICNKCNDSISNFAFNKHYNACKGINKNLRKEKKIIGLHEINIKKLNENFYLCLECNKQYSKQGIGTHFWRAHTETGKKFTANNDILHSKPAWNKGLTKETDNRVKLIGQKNSILQKGKPSNLIWTDEMRKAKSEWRKQLHIKYPESHPNRRLAGNRNKWTYPEKIAGDWLDKNNFIYEKNKHINKYYPDFVIGSIIIEIDGEYWHDKNKDSIRDENLKKLGYTVYRIKAKERIEEKLQKILIDKNF